MLERETLHVMDDKQRVALVETKTITNPDDESPIQLIRFQLGNHLGSAVLELDDQAQVISYEEYHPYGSTAYHAARSQTETSKRYRYTGKERDEETGFSYHGARYYAPWLGRWVSCDPIGLVDGINFYIYVQVNPVRFQDPSGTQTQPTGYSVRNNPEKVFVENENARKNWNDATNEVLENKFGKGSSEKNLKAFEEMIDSLPNGPQQINKRLNEGSKSGFARRIYDSVRSKFYQREATNPSWSTYTDSQKKLLRDGRAPDPLQQVEHLSDLAKNPKNALNPNDQYFTEGGRKGGIPKGSPHGQKNSTAPGSPGQRLRDWQAKNTASEPAAPPPSTPSKPAEPSAPPQTEPAKPSPEPPAGRPAGSNQSTKEIPVTLKSGRVIRIAGNVLDFVALAQAKDHDDVVKIIGGMVAWRIAYGVAVKPFEPAIIRFIGAAGTTLLNVAGGLTTPLLFIRPEPKGA